jgi:hypothetical protein
MGRWSWVLLMCACASAPPPRAQESGEEIIERGGESSLAAPPASTTIVEGGALIAWAQSEVPGDSRLPAALAMVDGLARAELLKALRAELTATSVVVASGEQQSASFAVAERARGALAQASPPQHAWIKVRRGGVILLRVYARASVKLPEANK